jgi:hypothetical protein
MRFKGFNSGLLAVGFAVAALCLGAGKAQAGQTNVNVYQGNGTTSISSNVTQFDWNADASGVAVGVGPFGSPLAVNQTFTFLYNANLVTFTGGTPTNPTDLKTTTNGSAFGANQYEFTITASLTEKVISFADLGGGIQTAAFTTTGGTLSIYYDDGTGATSSANLATGAGYNDGPEIARFTAVGGTSTFTTTSSSSGIGATSFDFNITGALDFVDADYLVGILGQIFDLHFISTQEYPPLFSTGVTPTGMFGGYAIDSTCTGPGTCDLLLQVDGHSFFTAVPEPGTLALWGMGLLALGFLSRWRRTPSPARS